MKRRSKQFNQSILVLDFARLQNPLANGLAAEASERQPPVLRSKLGEFERAVRNVQPKSGNFKPLGGRKIAQEKICHGGVTSFQESIDQPPDGPEEKFRSAKPDS